MEKRRCRTCGWTGDLDNWLKPWWSWIVAGVLLLMWLFPGLIYIFLASRTYSCLNCGSKDTVPLWNATTFAASTASTRRAAHGLNQRTRVLLACSLSVVILVLVASISAPLAPPARPPAAPTVTSQPHLDKSMKAQLRRRALLGELIKAAVFQEVEGDRVWVQPRFYELDFKMKQEFVSVVYAFDFDGSSESDVVTVVDGRSGNDVGTFSTRNPGLKMER